MVERAVFKRPASAYARLFAWAGVELGDVRALVNEIGLEPALARLHDAGVQVTIDEVKGRRPIERPGLSLPPDVDAFANPLSARYFPVATGGSRAAPRRIRVDLASVEQDAAYHSLFRSSFGLEGRPYAVWRVIPPNSSGLNNSLYQVKVGARVERWFNPYKPPRAFETLNFAVFTRYTVMAGRLLGADLASPEYCPPQDGEQVARWLADQRAAGTPAVLDTQAAYGVRACLAALEHGLDISGTLFRFGGEPLTEGKARVVARAGARAVCHYTMGETSRIGVACARPNARDDVHLLRDKLAILQRDRPVDGSGRTVGALHYTALTPSARMLVINMESEDYAVLEDRACGCLLGELGLTLHAHEIRSYEKLTSEGVHFLGTDLIRLVDEVLPRRFGGEPTDYQLVEEEVGGLPKVSIVIRPRLGPVAEDQVVSAVVNFLKADRPNRLMGRVWEQGDTLRVVRREPSLTPQAKILPLHRAVTR